MSVAGGCCGKQARWFDRVLPSVVLRVGVRCPGFQYYGLSCSARVTASGLTRVSTYKPNAIKLSVTGRQSKRKNDASRESSRNCHPESKGGILFVPIRALRRFLLRIPTHYDKWPTANLMALRISLRAGHDLSGSVCPASEGRSGLDVYLCVEASNRPERAVTRQTLLRVGLCGRVKACPD